MACHVSKSFPAFRHLDTSIRTSSALAMFNRQTVVHMYDVINLMTALECCRNLSTAAKTSEIMNGELRFEQIFLISLFHGQLRRIRASLSLEFS